MIVQIMTVIQSQPRWSVLVTGERGESGPDIYAVERKMGPCSVVCIPWSLIADLSGMIHKRCKQIYEKNKKGIQRQKTKQSLRKECWYWWGRRTVKRHRATTQQYLPRSVARHTLYHKDTHLGCLVYLTLQPHTKHPDQGTGRSATSLSKKAYFLIALWAS